MRIRGLALTALVAGAALAFALPVGVIAGESENRAAVIVDTGQTVKKICVRFSEDSISGKDLLDRAGVDPVYRTYSGEGVAVCALCGKGCPPDSSCLTCGGNSYWAYHRAPSGTTTFTASSRGAGTTSVRDGDVEGWRWGTGAPPEWESVQTVCMEVVETSAPSEGTAANEPPPATAEPVGTTAAPSPPSTEAALPEPEPAPATTAPAATVAPSPSTASPGAPPPSPSFSSTTRPTSTTAVALPAVTTARPGGESGGAGAWSLVPVGVIVAALSVWLVVVRRARRRGSGG